MSDSRDDSTDEESTISLGNPHKTEEGVNVETFSFGDLLSGWRRLLPGTGDDEE